MLRSSVESYDETKFLPSDRRFMKKLGFENSKPSHFGVPGMFICLGV